MAERPIWRGHLRLALVSCPVALYTASRDRTNLHFHFINPETGNRVRMITLDAETGDELSRGKLAKGYEFKKDHYVIIDEADFEAAKVESSSTMTVTKFVDMADIDPVYFDASYYLVPDGDAGADVYAVLRDAIAKSGKMALSRVVISRRERAVALMPSGRGMVLHTLHEAKDIASPQSLFEGVPKAKPDDDMVALATQLIDRQTGHYDPADSEDRYEARLRAVIDAKLKGEGLDDAPEEEPDRGNVIDLMAALKKSLGQSAPAEEKPKHVPARAVAAKKPAHAAPAKSAPAKKPPVRAAAIAAKRPTRKAG